MWAWGLLLALLPSIREQMEGPYKTDHFMVVAATYGTYVIVPILVMIRVASTPVFNQSIKHKTV